jgi:Xaa-Pro aminopeptidase
VSTPVNVRYLTGFTGSAGLVVVTADRFVLVTDGRYDLGVRDDIGSGEIARVTVRRVERRYDLTLAQVLQESGARRAAFESTHVTVATLDAWSRAAPTVQWLPAQKVVEARRSIKDAVELAHFRVAGPKLAAIATRLGEFVAPGRTERDIARRIDAAIVQAGFSEPAFPTIVASGPHSAHPHARPTDRPLAPGDLVVLDFGGVLDGYCVDLTRAAAVQPVSLEAQRLYESVRDAHTAAVRAVRAGVDLSSVDAAARGVLESAGLGDAFSHSTGHGLGLEVHEAPRVGRADPDSSERAETGMVFTIEPGAYVERLGGVRLEDDVLVTAEGCEVLTEASRDLLVV